MRLIVGMSGASGAPMTIALLRKLQMRSDVETHLVMSRSAEMTIAGETAETVEQVRALADYAYPIDAIGAKIASGSFRTEGMIIVPCSMKTVAGIVSGYSDNLLLRAADVVLKERRKLVLVARESPLGTIHLRNLYELSQMGVMVMPPMMNFYNHADTLEQQVDKFTDRVLSQFGLSEDGYEWQGM
jgi:polyprenyl P-hydroxybenzoate/phenylacrylic acid decarboxylase-like protein